MIDKLVKVNLGSDGVFPVVKITQGDDMWSFRFQIFLDNKRWTIPAGSVINLAGQKPDGHSFDMSCTIADNEAHIDCTKQLTAAAGFVNAVLQIFSNEGKLVQTCKIVFACAPDPKGNIPVSESDMSAYERLLEQYEAIIASGAGTVRDDIVELQNGKQDKIAASGVLKGNGDGSVVAATAGTDYATPTQVNQKYTKPAAGIPKEDMAADVQTSLGKADTALQEHQSLAAYRTAADQDEIDAAQNTEIDTKYTKPANGIPSSDLDDEVQASLGKADTALQVHQSLAAYRTAAAQDEIDAAQNTVISAKYTKPDSGIPVSDLAQDIQDALDDVADLKEAAISGSATDLIVDNNLSATSENPVQNKVIKAKFDELENSIPAAVTVDSDFSDTSENPIQNKVITEKLQNALFIATPAATGILNRTRSNGEVVTSIAKKGVAYGSYNFQATLSANGWTTGQTDITQTIMNTKIIADGNSYAYIITPSGASFAEYVNCEIYADDITTNSMITFHAGTIPENDLTVNIIRLVSTTSV